MKRLWRWLFDFEDTSRNGKPHPCPPKWGWAWRQHDPGPVRMIGGYGTSASPVRYCRRCGETC